MSTAIITREMMSDEEYINLLEEIITTISEKN
jgi:hypothetical protein